jgi:hypothetical protein
MRHIILTNCTAKKRASLPVLKFAVQTKNVTIKDVADQWTNLVQEAKNVLPASKVYVGRTVKDAIDAGNMLGAPVFFISAGLGLISQDRLIPSYNLSISPNQKQTPVPDECDLRTTLSMHSCSPSEWWNLLNHQKPMLDILNANEDTLIWIALPSSYINLVQEDLLAIPKTMVKNLRIFTSPAGVQAFAPKLRVACLPYDERLNSVANSEGTRNDFPQRALLHYLRCLQGRKLNLQEGKAKVQRFLSDFSVRDFPVREKKSDEEIIRLLERYWSKTNGSAARLLRVLRDDLKISCEQRRFSSLWRSVNNQKLGGKYAA